MRVLVFHLGIPYLIRPLLASTQTTSDARQTPQPQSINIARVSLDHTSIKAENGKIEVWPGRSDPAEIKAGPRRMIEYLLSPLDTAREGRDVVLKQWRKHFNTIRPHSSLYYRRPEPQTSAPTLLHLDRSTAMQ